MELVGNVFTPWGRIEIQKHGPYDYKPVMVHKTGKRFSLSSEATMAHALYVAHSLVKTDPTKLSAMKKLDMFTHIDSDANPGANVNKDWKEQDDLRLIDKVEHAMNANIKPMDQQFPHASEKFHTIKGEDMIKQFERMSHRYSTESAMTKLSGGVDEKKWNEAKEKSKEEYGSVKWNFVNWLYDEMGGK